MRVPDPWVIEDIKRREENQRKDDEASWNRQPRLEIPYWPDVPKVRESAPTLDGDGTVRIDFSL